MLQSGGVLVKGSETILWSGTTETWGTWPRELELSQGWASYGAIYREQMWVTVCVNKRAMDVARLPLKTYTPTAKGRNEVADHPLAQLLRKPNDRWSRFFFWLWTCCTFDIYGEVFWGKIRDGGGRPAQLVPLHPTGMNPENETADGRVVWTFQNGTIRIDRIPPEDIVHFRTYNPDSLIRGLSPLEPLRRTLENEDAARRATSAFWRNGARPGTALSHPGKLSDDAAKRLKVRWDELAGGVDNTGTSIVLEEGMKPEKMSLTAEEAQYIDSRKLNREEVIAVYDTPPPTVHILDHATYSNITEQMRSKYRDSGAPRLKWFEDELKLQLRDSVRPGRREADFGDDVYPEFLLDEVLRGDFETRTDSYQKAINAGWLTPAEVREMENRPFIKGSDRLMVNSTMVPLDAAQEPEAPEPPPPELVRSLMGRLSRQTSLDDIDPKVLTAGLNGASALVLAELESAKAAGRSVAQLRERLKEVLT